MKNKVWLTFVRVAAVVLTVACLLTIAYMQSVTLISWWVPLLIGAAVAVPVSLHAHDRFASLTGFTRKWLNFTAAAVVLCVAVTAMFYCANYFVRTADGAETSEKAVVAKKYRTKHYRTRRINRRVVGRGQPYWEYRADIAHADSTITTLTVQLDAYNRISVGDSVVIPVRRGALGFKIIDPANIRYEHAHKRRARTRYFGRIPRHAQP